MRWLNKDSPLINNFFLSTLLLLTIFLSIYHIIFIIFLIAYLVYLFVKIRNKIIILFCIICALIVFLHFVLISIKINNYPKYVNEELLVIDVMNRDNNNQVILKKGKYQFYLYTKRDVKVGDVIKIEVIREEVMPNTIENGFNYKKYLSNNLVLALIKTDEFKIIKHKFCIYNIRSSVINYIDKYFKDDTSNSYVKAFITGDKSEFSDELKDSLKENGITHLFAISGLHVSLLVLFLSKILKVFIKKENIINIVCIVFLSLYLIIASFAASILRAYLMYVISLLNKRKLKSVLSSLDILSIVFILMLVYNPYYAFQLGFALSFIATFTIILINKNICSLSKTQQILCMSFVMSILTLPYIVNINYEVNVLSPILNIFYISFVSTTILPFTFFVFVFPLFSGAYSTLMEIFTNIVVYSGKCAVNVQFPSFTPYIVFAYLLFGILFTIVAHRYKKVIAFSFLIFLIIISNSAFFYRTTSIDFLYLNDGEASIIRDLNKVVVVDTGDGYKDEVYNFLRSKGIKRINFLIITHNHLDHYGGIARIYQNIKVDNIIVSKYNEAYYTYYNVSKRLSYGDIITLGNLEFLVLSPKIKSDEENDNSLVLKVKHKKYDFDMLMLGDAGKVIEEEIINDIKNAHFDLIKIAHHGSSTSTSNLMLENIYANYAIIMVGKKWKDTFPSKEVVYELKKYHIKYYCTSDYYSIKYDIKRKKFKCLNN